MAQYRVIKPLNDKNTGKTLAKGTIIERLVKDVDKFEKEHGTDYLERVKEDEGDD